MSCVSYSNNHTNFTEHIPVPLQRLRMDEYCKKNKLKPSYDHLELYTFDHLPILKHLIEEHKGYNIVFFSIFSLPDDIRFRKELIIKALENDIVLHFSNEDIILNEKEQLVEFEDILSYARLS